MKDVNGLPLLSGPLFAPDGTECADWWELAEWFKRYEYSLWEAGVELPLEIDGHAATGDTAQRMRAQSRGYRDAYEAIRSIAENQVVEEVLGHVQYTTPRPPAGQRSPGR